MSKNLELSLCQDLELECPKQRAEHSKVVSFHVYVHAVALVEAILVAVIVRFGSVFGALITW